MGYIAAMQRESMEYDVVIVGGGPAGLAAAIRLGQLASERDSNLSVCLLEKGSEIGAHILSGAVLEPRALMELIPDWQERDAPLKTSVLRDEVYFFTGAERAIRIPRPFVPKPMHNEGNYVISLGQFCRWLAAQAEALEVEIFPGFAAAELRYDDDGRVAGVVTGDMGVNAAGEPKDGFEPGMELRARYTLLAEGSRGHLGRQAMERFDLAAATPQHYGIGLKELWEIPPQQHEAGLVLHGAGWPLSENGCAGGCFLYHLEDNQVALGLIVDLNYRNPHVSPFDEFQRWKHHPLIKRHLVGGRRLAYGARALSKGGFHSLPTMTLPGALLIGCDAGTLNFAKIKGIHTAMKSGMLAAETVFEAMGEGPAGGVEPTQFLDRYRSSWLYEELYRARNFGPALHRWGPYLGGVYNYLEQNWFRGRLPLNIRDKTPDHLQLKPAAECRQPDYPRPDGEISFDRLSSVYVSNTHHEEDQPCHLRLVDEEVPIAVNLARYDAPEQRYCPAGVYEIVDGEQGKPRLQINAQNCVHCKTCDIKDPGQNITWVPPEGGGGPNYPNM